MERRPGVRLVNDPIDDPRRLAVTAIVRIDDEGAYANVVLPKILGDTTMEARDKGFATELVYGSTRMKRRLDHLVDRFLLEPPPPSARAALRIGAHQLLHLDTPPHAAVSATVAAAPKRFRGLVNAVLRKVARLARRRFVLQSNLVLRIQPPASAPSLSAMRRSPRRRC